MMPNIIKNTEKKINYIIFFIIFAIGLSVSKDYGLTIDDEYYRINGLYYYQFIKNTIFDLNVPLVENNIKYAPALFEILLAFITDIFSINEINDIYKTSHKLNFIIFFISLIFFYKLVYRLYNSEIYAILSVIFLITTPRFFAESYFNSRDIFFLSLFILNIYSIYLFLAKKNLFSIIVLAFSTAVLVISKIFGVVPILLFSFFFIMQENKKNDIRFKLVSLFKIYTLVVFFIYILWPFLWDNPLKNFTYAYFFHLTEQNKLSVITYFYGKYISSSEAPWHYRLTWMFLTIPIYLIVIFLTGLTYNISRFSSSLLHIENKNKLFTTNDLLKATMLSILLSVIFLTSQFNESKLNGWRHLYFLYSIIIIFSIDGLRLIIKKYKQKIFRTGIIILIFFNISYLIIWSVKNHPNQYVFFNFLLNKHGSKNFDLDYWGVSNLEAIKYIIKTSKKDRINVGTASFSSLYESTLKLSKIDRDRINIVFELDDADYILDNSMKRKRKNYEINKKRFIKFHEIKVYNVPINSIYKKITN